MHIKPTHPSYSKVMEVACLLSMQPARVKNICRDVGVTMLEVFEILSDLEDQWRINYYVEPILSVSVDSRDFDALRAEAAAYYDEVYHD